MSHLLLFEVTNCDLKNVKIPRNQAVSDLEVANCNLKIGKKPAEIHGIPS